MLITRRIEFSASHFTANSTMTHAENQALYGGDANPHGHGHNYVLEVTLEGDPDPVTGMIVDLKDVKQVLEREVVTPMDHRHLNYEVSPFDRIVPTTENVAIEIWRRLQPSFDQSAARLKSIRLYETEDLYVDYDGE
jgi:6-pyruvoyltetrahydropterin/6-carboxytetrahydropterin synthase